MEGDNAVSFIRVHDSRKPPLHHPRERLHIRSVSPCNEGKRIALVSCFFLPPPSDVKDKVRTMAVRSTATW